MLANKEMATEMEICEALTEIDRILESNGYQTCDDAELSCIVALGDPKNPIPAVITVTEGQLTITCQLTTLGVIGEDQLTEFLVSALDLNTKISPYAVALISNDDEESHRWPVVLLDSIPLGDLQESELLSALSSLSIALPLAADLIGSFEAMPAA